MSFQNSIVHMRCPLIRPDETDLPQASGVKWVDG
ncbi:hypothetical protein L3Y19_gp043 [Gordonia phage Neville]|uniref:Uncharacterized protein n=1 Tax=Gordonia phage Neville TaxID=2301693 RepID=A0A385DYA1_9CAUD|nr:hypothetical protein L3Y19_gp043 [Gordonia phage Neville]AXQ64493.1 hypothetical protein SEA_NEVILLE_43 [Gordonia phage Neville]